MALLLQISFYLLIVAATHGTIDQPNLLERLLQSITKNEVSEEDRSVDDIEFCEEHLNMSAACDDIWDNIDTHNVEHCFYDEDEDMGNICLWYMCVFDHIKQCTPEALANVTDGAMLKAPLEGYATQCIQAHCKAHNVKCMVKTRCAGLKNCQKVDCVEQFLTKCNNQPLGETEEWRNGC